MMTAASLMKDEDLRLMAVGLANGDVIVASRIVDYVRPQEKTQRGACAYPPAPEPGTATGEPARPLKDREQEWRWSTDRSYAVVRRKDGAVVHVDGRTNDLSLEGAGNGLSWPIEHGPGPYDVFVFDRETGNSGFVGVANGCWFLDDNISPDMANPLPMEMFSEDLLARLDATPF